MKTRHYGNLGHYILSKFINFQNSHETNRSMNVGILTFFPTWGCTAVLPRTEVKTCGKGKHRVRDLGEIPCKKLKK